MATQTAAQARQSQLDQLDGIGSSQQDYETGNVFSAAENDVADFIQRAQDNIKNSGMVVTGNIENMSIRVTDEGIEILGNDYLIYQDKGVRGSVSSDKAPDSPFKYTDSMPPLDVFIEYVKKKNLHLRNQGQFFKGESPFKDTTEEEKIKTLAVLIQKKVFKEGFKPRNVFAKEIPALKEALKSSVKNFASESIKEVFKFKR